MRCKDCQDHFCAACFDRVHESDIYAKHAYMPVASVASADGELLAQQTVRDITKTQQRPSWVKFEYFNFPVSKANDFHSQIAAHFEFL
jgi:hypothetical protein